MQAFESILELVSQNRIKEAVEAYMIMMKVTKEEAEAAINGQKKVLMRLP